MIEDQCAQCGKTFNKGELWGIRRPNFAGLSHKEVEEQALELLKLSGEDRHNKILESERNPPSWTDLWVCKTCHKFIVEFDQADESTQVLMQMQLLSQSQEEKDQI